MNKNFSNYFLFILGVFCETRVYLFGALALSEFIVMPLAIILLVRDWGELRRLGFTAFIYWGGLLTGCMLLSCYLNSSPNWLVIKKLASIYGIFSWYIVFFTFLKDNYKGMGYFFLGAAISTVITIFAFNPHVSAAGLIESSVDIETVVNGQLFWFGRLMAFGQLPFVMAYLKTPTMYVICAPIALTIFLLYTTVSGRSGSLIILVAGIIMLMVGKSRLRMKKFGGHLILFLSIALVVVIGYKVVYSYGAIRGIWGEDAQIKYMHQVGEKSRGSILGLLMSGRKEFFMALPAIAEKPIFGHGLGAGDRSGVQEEFLRKYGTEYDYDYHLALKRISIERGGTGIMPLLSHSHILGAWMRYGVGGLLFYCYVIWLMYKHVKLYFAAIPQWCGYFAIIIPHYTWHILFSPAQDRWQFALLVVSLLFARATAQGRLHLPLEMEMEARKYD